MYSFWRVNINTTWITRYLKKNLNRRMSNHNIKFMKQYLFLHWWLSGAGKYGSEFDSLDTRRVTEYAFHQYFTVKNFPFYFTLEHCMHHREIPKVVGYYTTGFTQTKHMLYKEKYSLISNIFLPWHVTRYNWDWFTVNTWRPFLIGETVLPWDYPSVTHLSLESWNGSRWTMYRKA